MKSEKNEGIKSNAIDDFFITQEEAYFDPSHCPVDG